MTSTPPSNPASPPRRSKRPLTGRTSLVTAAAIVGVLVAGTAAVAANMGILDAADSSAIGDLAATDDLLPPAGVDSANVTVVRQSTPSTTAPRAVLATAPTVSPQQYDIENTGTVWIMTTTTSGLALDHVLAEPGWAATLSQSDPGELRVDFVNGDRRIEFTAMLAEDHTVIGDVTEPTTVVASSQAGSRDDVGTASVIGVVDDSYSDDSYDEHEGADDDD